MYFETANLPSVPYKGLVPYAPEDAAFFFGREKWQKTIITNLKVSPITLLSGASGVGKSSILQAGVVHTLHQLVQENLKQGKAPKLAVVIFNSWHDRNLLDSLLECIENAVVQVMPEKLEQLRNRVLESLKRQKETADKEETSLPSKFVQYLTAYSEILGDERGRGRLFIILDQFEEYFQYHPEKTEKERFAVEFPGAVNDSNLRVNFLISIREESFSKLNRFKGQILSLFDNLLELEHLDRESARYAIVKPLGEYNSRQVIAERLMKYRLTLLSGESGVGKSVILREGITAHLNQLIKQNLENQDSVKFALVIFDSWERDLLNRLIQKIKGELKKTFLDIQLSDRDFNLVELLKAWTEYIEQANENHRLFIVLDQFEQYFRYSFQNNVKEEFIQQLSDAVNSPDLRVNFLISIRENSLEKLESLKDLAPQCFNSHLHILNPAEKGKLDDEYGNLFDEDKLATEEKIKRATEERRKRLNAFVMPLRQYPDRPLLSEGSIGIDEALVEKVLNEVKNAIPTGNGIGGLELKKKTKYCIEAPYLQVLMTRLWQEEINAGPHTLQLETLTKLGGAEKIFREHVETQMEKLEEDERAAAAEFFQYMITPAGTKIAFPVLELVPREIKMEPGKLKSLLEKLAKGEQRILRPAGPLPDRPEIQRYEIFHDVLAQPILSWRRRYLNRQEIAKRLQEIKEQRRQRNLAIERGLPAQALRQYIHEQYELSALLARQAYLFNQRDPCEVLDQVDEALRQVLSIADLGSLLMGHQEGVACVAFSHDSRFLASSSWDETILLWDLHCPGQEPTVLSGHTGSVNTIAFSPDGQQLASGSDDRTVRLWDLRNLDAKPQILGKHQAIVKAVTFRGDGRWLASGSDDRSILLWDLYHRDQQPIALRGHEGDVNAVAFSPTEEMLVSGSEDTTVRLWDLKEMALSPPKVITSRILPGGHDDKVNAVAFSLDGTMVASGSDDRTVRLWYLNQLDKVFEVLEEGHKEPIRSVAFSPESHSLAASGDDQTIRLWDLRRLSAPPRVLKGQFFVISSVAFSPDGQWLASGSWDSTVRLQHLHSELAKPETLKGDTRFVRAVTLSSDGQLLASGGDDRKLRVWNLKQTGVTPLALDHPEAVWAVAFSPNGRRLASGCEDGIVRVWKYPDKRDAEPDVLAVHSAPIRCVTFSPQGDLLASASKDNTIGLWNLQDINRPLKLLKGHSGGVMSVAFSPQGDLLASASEDSTILLWNLQDLERPPKLLEGHSGGVMSVEFRPVGQWLASGGRDKTVRLWNLEQPNPESIVFKGHRFWVGSVAFSPDGQTLASGSYDWTIRLWNLNRLVLQDANKDPIILSGHNQSVTCMAFCADGELLASGSYDQTIFLWKASARRAGGGRRRSRLRRSAGRWPGSRASRDRPRHP